MKSIISVIVCICNESKMIEKCLDSILNQTISSIEVIVVEDHVSKEILERIHKYENRVVLIHNKKRLGLNGSRNQALKVAKGEYIGFVDCNDYIDPRMYEEMIRYMNDDIDMVSCGWFLFSSRGMKPRVLSSKRVDGSSLSSVSHYVFDKVFKKKIIDTHKLCFSKEECYDDLDFLVQYQYYSNEIEIISEPYYYFSDSHLLLSSNNLTLLFQEFDSCILFLNRTGQFYRYEKEFIRVCSFYYLEFVRHSKNEKDFELIKKGVLDFLTYFKNNFRHYRFLLNCYDSKVYKFYRSSYFLMSIYLYLQFLFSKNK